MEEVILKEIKNLKGEVRGIAIKTDGEYIMKNIGKEGFKKLEDKIKEWGFSPIEYEKISNMAFYPLGLRIASLLAIKEIFNFNEEKIKDIALYATRRSTIIKLFFKYIVSLKYVFEKETPKIWKEHITVGWMEPAELSEEKKYAVLRVHDFKTNRIYCTYLEGYFSSLFHLIVDSKTITCEETACPSLKNSDYHEFLIKWQ